MLLLWQYPNSDVQYVYMSEYQWVDQLDYYYWYLSATRLRVPAPLGAPGATSGSLRVGPPLLRREALLRRIEGPDLETDLDKNRNHNRTLIDTVIYICVIHILHMVVDLNSFICKWPFFANKQFSFANLSRTPCLSFAEPMLSNNSSYEESFITCQITPNYHG